MAAQDWATTSGSSQQPDWWCFKRLPHGGFWERLEQAPALFRLEDLVAKGLCLVLGCESIDLDKRFVAGQFSLSIIKRLAGALHDPHFLQACEASCRFQLCCQALHSVTPAKLCTAAKLCLPVVMSDITTARTWTGRSP